MNYAAPITDEQLADLITIGECMTGVNDSYSFPGKLTPGQAIMALVARLRVAEASASKAAAVRAVLQGAVLMIPNRGVTHCHGDKCREPYCASCQGEEHAEAAARTHADAVAAMKRIAGSP